MQNTRYTQAEIDAILTVGAWNSASNVRGIKEAFEKQKKVSFKIGQILAIF